MKTILFLFLLLCVELYAASEKAKYNNCQVYRTKTTEKNHILILYEMFYGGLIVDFWKMNLGPNATTDIVVPCHKQAHFNESMKRSQMQFELIIPDIQELIRKTKPDRDYKKFHWSDFHKHSKITEWLAKLAVQHNKYVELLVVGRSYEGRNLTGVKLTFKKGNKAVFFEGGIHAREWISPAVVTYIFYTLLTSKNPIVRDVAESFDWYFFPVFNPDGYDYTFSTDRLWKMTRQPHGVCRGVDANRNWAYFWNNAEATNTSCTANYLGPHPFSEPETLAMSNFIISIHDEIVAYLSVRSYGQYLLLPFAFTEERVENYDELQDVGKRVIDTIKKRYGTKYQIKSWAEILHPTSGTSIDWIKGTFKTPVTYTIMLPDKKKYGFLIPASEILPTAKETMDGILTMMIEARYLGYNRIKK